MQWYQIAMRRECDAKTLRLCRWVVNEINENWRILSHYDNIPRCIPAIIAKLPMDVCVGDATRCESHHHCEWFRKSGAYVRTRKLTNNHRIPFINAETPNDVTLRHHRVERSFALKHLCDKTSAMRAAKQCENETDKQCENEKSENT